MCSYYRDFGDYRRHYHSALSGVSRVFPAIQQRPRFPSGERLLVCFNPRLRQQSARKREDLLRATEATLAKIAAAARKHRPGPENRDRTLQSLGRQAHRHKVEKHFDLTVTDDDLQGSRNREKIKAEARLDGIYVIRTNLDTAAIDTHAAVAAYKSLSQVERAFRSMKMTRLHVRPVFVYTEQHVLGHVFLCLLAWYLEWHLRRRLAPLLFEDEAPPVRDSPVQKAVQKAEPSQPAKAKAATKRTPDGDPVHSVTTLLNDLATVTLNEVTLPGHPDQCLPPGDEIDATAGQGVRFTENRSRGSCCHKQGRLILNKLPLYN